MPGATRHTWRALGGAVLAIALVAAIPFGLFMAWTMDDPPWLWFCSTLILFLS
jgi:hypothetical protein